MLFSEVIGQQEVKNHLIKSVNEQRIPHAQLFLGDEGVGALPLALAYAQYINCENRSLSDSCGVCASCQKYNKLIHPDLHFVYPVIKSGSKKAVSDVFLDKWRPTVLATPYMNLNTWLQTLGAENKQGGIFVDESDEILRKLSLKTYESEYKIMIIWMAEKLRPEPANKLLKILEEPPAKTVFLLISQDSGQLLTTILSRCQLIKIPRIDSRSLSEALVQRRLVEASQVERVARLASGNYLKAIETIEISDEEKYNFDKFVQWMRLCWNWYNGTSNGREKVFELTSWVDDMASVGRERQKNFLNYALRFVRENFIKNYNQPEVQYMNVSEEEFAEKFHVFINENNIDFFEDELSKAIYHIEYNANPKILFLDLAVKISRQLIKTSK